jgi:hypothetical protein
MERKLMRKNVTITAALDANARFTSDLFCEFTPDEVRVKQIALFMDATKAGAFLVYCDSLVSGAALGSIMDGVVSFTATTFPLDRPVSGTYAFRVMNGTSAATTLATGRLNIHLEFRKYI